MTGLREIESMELPEKEELDKNFALTKLQEISTAFDTNDAIALRNIANELISLAVERHDRGIAKAAMVAYALHKILSKSHFVMHGNWPEHKKMLMESLKELTKKARKEKQVFLVSELDSLGRKIIRFDSKFGSYLENLIEKSRIKYAAEAFYLGMSLSKAADFTGTDPKSLQKYLSNTKQFDEKVEEPSINERTLMLEKALGGK